MRLRFDNCTEPKLWIERRENQNRKYACLCLWEQWENQRVNADGGTQNECESTKISLHIAHQRTTIEYKAAEPQNIAGLVRSTNDERIPQTFVCELSRHTHQQKTTHKDEK